MTDKDYILPVVERETIIESLYIDSLNTTMKFLLAVKEDEAVIVKYISEQFSKNEPIDAASGISPDELSKRYANTIKRSLDQSFTILAVDCFQICGVITANRVSVGEKRTEQLKNDYSNEIKDSNASCLAAKQIDVFVNEFESFTPNFLPEDCKEFYRIDLFSVLPEYQGVGLGKRLWLESLKLAKRQGFKFVESGCSAKASTCIGTKLGMKIVFSFPYKDFQSNGRPIFGEVLHDGGTQANLLLGNFDEIKFDQEKFQLPQAYKLDSIERPLIEEFCVPKLGRNLKIQIALESDNKVIKHFILEEFYKQGPMLRTMQGNKKDHQEIKEVSEEESIGNGLSMIVEDNGYLCAIISNKTVQIDRSKKGISELDFTKEMENVNAESPCLQKLITFITWLKSLMVQYLPQDCNQIFYIDSLSVHPEYRSCQIGQKLWSHSLKIAQLNEYKFVYAICTAIASTKIALNSGMKTVFAYPFTSLKYKGINVFPNGRLYEGCQEASLIIGDLDKILNKQSE